MKRVHFHIQRYDPEQDAHPRVDHFRISVESRWTILDCLEAIQADHDPSLSFRSSCRQGLCGADAMLIHGTNRLACQTLVCDLNTNVIQLGPLPALPVIRDLVSDLTPLLDRFRQTLPYLIRSAEITPTDSKQSPENIALLREASRCIMCGACTSSCPSLWTNDDYLGPAAFLAAFRWNFDERDEGGADRNAVIGVTKGLLRCHTILNCIEACPRGINLAWHIGKLKRSLLTGRPSKPSP